MRAKKTRHAGNNTMGTVARAVGGALQRGLSVGLCVGVAAFTVVGASASAMAEDTVRNKQLDALCCTYGRFFAKGAPPSAINTRIFKIQAERLPDLLYSLPRDGMDLDQSTRECKRLFTWCNTESARERSKSRFHQTYRRGTFGPGTFVSDVMRYAVRYTPEILSDTEFNYVCLLDSLNPPSSQLFRCKHR